MSDEEAFVHAYTTELIAHRGVCDTTYRQAVERFGEAGVVELTSLIGYFAAVSMVLNDNPRISRATTSFDEASGSLKRPAPSA